jgi:ribosome assembly protein 4
MSTQLPPPKRQKLHNVAHERDVRPTKAAEQAERFIPNIVVQFKNAEDGSPLGPAINLPADTGRDALQMLVNKLKGEVSHVI